VETIKTANWGYVRLYGCRPKSVCSGLDCSLNWMMALSVTHSWGSVCGLQHHIS